MLSSSTQPTRVAYGFTLIELLIVIAIILILIAIALPNFLEAQIRAKVARVNADLRTIGIAMESYLLDWKIYPPDSEDEFDAQAHGLGQLTTPLKYLSALPFDVFVGSRAPVDGTPVFFEMASTGLTPILMSLGRLPYKRVNAYALYSHGPDINDNFEKESRWPWHGPGHPCPTPGAKPEMGTHSYSPTNGTTSTGDIVKLGGQFKAGHWCLDWIEVKGDGFEHAE